MKITVERFSDSGDATLSLVRVNGEFICFGLEDEYRAEKVAGETRIPAGKYKVGIRDEGGFHNRYSNDDRFKNFHEGMLQVLDVPNFEYILIHVGNTEEHTAGCLLVGMGADSGLMRVQASAVAYEQLYKDVIDEAKLGHLEIEYINMERG